MKIPSVLSITESLDQLLEQLLPATSGLQVHQLIVTSEKLTLVMASSTLGACCPLAWLFLRNPEHLEKQDKLTLSRIRQTQQIDVAYGLAQRFVTMVKERDVKLLETWLRDRQKSGISDLVTFAQGLEKEGSALDAALTLPYSNGPAEGKINKLKYIKRSMYGRSGFPLLRQKVLKAA